MGETRPYFRDDRNLCHGGRLSPPIYDMLLAIPSDLEYSNDSAFAHSEQER